MKKIYLVVLLVIAILLEAIPFGTGMIFADGPDETIRRTFSYFSLIPFGYANFAPLIVACLTCLMLILAVLSFKNEKWIKRLFFVSLVTAVLSLMPLVYGFAYFTIVSWIISALLAVECVIAHILRNKES